MPAEFVEREYNLRAAFPDHPHWFARWAADSRGGARRVLTQPLNVRYGSGPKQTIDLFPSANPRGALLFIHGGYWRALDKSDHSFVAAPLVARASRWRSSTTTCARTSASRASSSSAAKASPGCGGKVPRYGVPTQRLVVAGHSAGGHLAAMLVATDWAAHGPTATLAGALALSGVFDLEPLVQASFNSDLKLDAAKAHGLSPIHLRPKRAVPLLVAAGADETSEFIRQSWLIWERWPSAIRPDAAVRCSIAARHHFSVLTDLGDPNSELLQATLSLF